jgi:hypothetical protein
MAHDQTQSDVTDSNPTTNFDAPGRVVASTLLSKAEKTAALDVLEQDSRELAVATYEGMEGGEPTALTEVLLAKAALDVPPVV